MLDALSNSEFAQWMIVSRWAYAVFLTAHGLGMAVVVGLVVMTALRVLGFPRQVLLGPYIKALPLGIAALVLNAASGTALFVADAPSLWANPSFQFKLVSIAVGLVVLWLFLRGPVRRAAAVEAVGGTFVANAGERLLAILSILIWCAAVIVSGRLIAYLAPDLFLI